MSNSSQLNFSGKACFPTHLGLPGSVAQISLTLANKPIDLSLATPSPTGFFQFHALAEVLLAEHSDLCDIVLDILTLVA